MFGKILELVLSAKSSAVSGVIILAGGVVVSASSGAGVSALTLQGPEPTPIVEVVEPEESPLDELLDETTLEPADDDEVLPVSEADCDDEATARAQARERIETAFTKYDTGLDTLRTKLDGKGSAQTYKAIENAGALLTEIREQAISALEDMGLCDTEELAAAQGAVAFAFRGGAAALLEVADRAIAAMETVYNLARSTVLQELERLKPTPTPKPKKTERPKATERPKPSKTPHCEDETYAAKKRLQRAFEQFHGGNDRLIKDLRGWADDRVMHALRAADEVLHETYDRTKERILRAGCATGGSSAMHLAEEAADVFERTYGGSKELFQTVAANKPDREACTEAMYAAKEVLYEAFDRWHGANDKLSSGIKSFASEKGVEAAKSADRTIHETYDRTKEAIMSAPCTKDGSSAMELARTAARIFETAHQNARIVVGTELAKREDDK